MKLCGKMRDPGNEVETLHVNRGQMSIFFDSKIDSKYQIMTSQLITSFHNVDLKFLNSKFFVLL